MAVITFR